MDVLLNETGKRILERRKQLRSTQEELAERANSTPQTVSSAGYYLLLHRKIILILYKKMRHRNRLIPMPLN